MPYLVMQGPSIEPVYKLSRLVVLASCLTLHGCVGLGAWTLGSRTETHETPHISETRGTLDVQPEPDGRNIKTGVELQTHWGEPDEIVRRADGREEWIYKTTGWRWHGMVLYAVIVPIPAMIPWGAQHLSFLLKDGQIESATHADWDFIAGAYCGYFSGWGCGAGTFEEARKAK